MMTKHTLRKILEIHHVLLLLSERVTPVAYAISKNRRIAERVVKEYEAIREEIMKDHALTTDDGTPRKALYSIYRDAPVEVDIDASALDLKTPKDHYIGYHFEDVQMVKAMIEEILDEEHEVVWHMIPESRMDGCNVEAELLIPLFDTIIVEGR